jgi:hypothetical protein
VELVLQFFGDGFHDARTVFPWPAPSIRHSTATPDFKSRMPRSRHATLIEQARTC